MINKIILILSLTTSILFAQQTLQQRYPNLPKELIALYKSKEGVISEIESKLKDFDSFSKKEKILFKHKIFDLVSGDLLYEYGKKDKKVFSDFLYLYKGLINYKAYLLVDKYCNNARACDIGKNLAIMNHNFFPTNLAYEDTYLWALVKNNKYDKALEKFPLLIKKLEAKNKDATEVIEHYQYVLKVTKFDTAKYITKLKKYINQVYMTKEKYDKEQLFNEFDSVVAINQDKFISEINSIIKRYVNDDLKLHNNKMQPEDKNKTTKKKLEYNIKDGVLYLKPNQFYNTLYEDLNKAVYLKKYKKIIIDLKDNQGGLLTSVKDFISAFLPNKKYNLFIIKEKNNKTTYTNNKSFSLDDTTPLEILIDKTTARGASYVASVLSKYNRAIVKGNIEQIDNSIKKVLPLSNVFKDMIVIIPSGFTVDKDGKDLEIKYK